MKRTNDYLMWLLIGLASIITIVVILQRPLDWLLILVACGFALLTVAWTGMYFLLKREQPEHALVGASYLNLPVGVGRHRRAGTRNMFRLIQFHFERHGIDRWSLLLAAGLTMMAAGVVGYAL
ncbi:MAG TPA: hypothetical protein VM616_05250 [Gammaproteobacteria bacterium]|nr:hypothetical protein [Gammaproteobacteria bacterium]